MKRPSKDKAIAALIGAKLTGDDVGHAVYWCQVCGFWFRLGRQVPPHDKGMYITWPCVAHYQTEGGDHLVKSDKKTDQINLTKEATNGQT